MHACMHAAIAADRDPTACDRHDMLKQAIKVASRGVPSKWLVSTGFSDVHARAVQLLPMFETCFKLEGPTMQRGSSKWLEYMMTKCQECEFRDLVEYPQLLKRYLQLQLESPLTDEFGIPKKDGVKMSDAAYSMLHSRERLPHHISSKYVQHLFLNRV